MVRLPLRFLDQLNKASFPCPRFSRFTLLPDDFADASIIQQLSVKADVMRGVAIVAASGGTRIDGSAEELSINGFLDLDFQ